MKEEVVVYCKQFSQCELMVVWLDFFVWDDMINMIVVVLVIVYVVGLCVKIDNDMGWYKMLLNVGVNGVIGISVDVLWDLQDLVMDVGFLNEQDVIMFVNCNGFCFWGLCMCLDDLLFVFENYMCIVQVIVDLIVEVQMVIIDGLFNLLLLCDIIEMINVKFCEWILQGYLIGGLVWYDLELNMIDVLKFGKVYFDYEYMLVLLFENLMLCQCIIDCYFVDFVVCVSV